MEQPKDLAALKSRIAGQSITLPEQCQRIARTAFERPDMIAFGTTRSIAAIFSVSPSTVVRSTQALGFSTFRDLRRLFRDHLKHAAARNKGVSSDQEIVAPDAHKK